MHRAPVVISAKILLAVWSGVVLGPPSKAMQRHEHKRDQQKLDYSSQTTAKLVHLNRAPAHKLLVGVG